MKPLDAERRNQAALLLHSPFVICCKHGLRDHDCGSPVAYRCPTCARTLPKPCATYIALTGWEASDD